MTKQLNIKGREKSLNQTLLAYIDLCVSLSVITFLIFFLHEIQCFRYAVVF